MRRAFRALGLSFPPASSGHDVNAWPFVNTSAQHRLVVGSRLGPDRGPRRAVIRSTTTLATGSPRKLKGAEARG
jgi:hypothetical protein